MSDRSFSHYSERAVTCQVLLNTVSIGFVRHYLQKRRESVLPSRVESKRLILLQKLLINAQVLIFENIKNDFHLASGLIKPVLNGLHGNLRRSLTWKHKDTCRNAAESYTLKAILRRQIQTRRIAGRQQVFMIFREPSLHDRPNRVKDIFAGQIIARRDHGLTGRLLIVSAMDSRLAAHIVIAAESQADA